MRIKSFVLFWYRNEFSYSHCPCFCTCNIATNNLLSLRNEISKAEGNLIYRLFLLNFGYHLFASFEDAAAFFKAIALTLELHQHAPQMYAVLPNVFGH